jgi:hypothetical protein
LSDAGLSSWVIVFVTPNIARFVLAAEVRIQVGSDLENPAPGSPRAVSRRATYDAIETIVAPDVADSAALLALDHVLIEKTTGVL